MKTLTWLLAALALMQVGRVRADELTASAHGEPAEVQVERRLDLNHADEASLVELPGIGPARAQAIIAYREAHGGFHSLSQLLQVKGIGRSLLKRLRPLVTL